jgi:hypothetical protein
MMGSGMFYRHGGRNNNESIHMNDLMDRCIGHVVGDPQPTRNLYTDSEEPSEGWRTELGNTGISECNRRLNGGALERWADLLQRSRDARRALDVCHCSTPYDERITLAATKNNAITDCELKRQTPARRG